MPGRSEPNDTRTLRSGALYDSLLDDLEGDAPNNPEETIVLAHKAPGNVDLEDTDLDEDHVDALDVDEIDDAETRPRSATCSPKARTQTPGPTTPCGCISRRWVRSRC